MAPHSEGRLSAISEKRANALAFPSTGVSGEDKNVLKTATSG